ncbi:hypothetical protein BGZ59_005061 [Podila verticillata]|nr:hypothetical protein BGZ59_005061 [Podila verticillata]
MSHYNNHQGGHHNNNNDEEYDNGYDSQSYPMQQQHMTPQQQRQEERRRHAEQSSASATAAAAAAGKGSSPWLSKQKKKSSKCKTIAWAVLALLLIAIAGVLAWYFAVFKKNQDNQGSGNSVGGKVPATGPTVVSPNGTVLPNNNYPLKKVFYGMAYVPLNAQLPNCYNTQQTVDEELQMVAQTTTRVRLYGTDCNVLRFTLDSIQRLKLDLKVVVGIWIDKDNATYTRQTTEFYSVVGTYGWNNIIGVSVGNEVIFDKYQTLPVLMSHIAEVKAKVVAMGQPTIPVFTSDLEEANQPPLTSSGNEDLAGVNLHPFFSGVPVEEGAAWFWKFLSETVSPYVNKNNAKPLDIWITEVGWPTFPATGNTKASVPSIPNLQKFLDTWLCDANAKKIPYYYFEFFDAPWKINPGSAVEGFWGLLTIDKKLKVKLPDCVIA